jgi:outer membrane protein
MNFRRNLSIPLAALALAPIAARAQEPLTVTTLEQALALAHEKNPGLRQSAERLTKNKAVVDQILALKRPTISASASYSRLFNAQSSFGAAAGGSAVGVQNPFPATLTGTPPGSQPVQLSQSTPVISSTSGATRSRQTGTGTGTGTGSGTNIFAGTDLNQYSTRLTISQLIDISGIVKAAQKIGDLQLQIDALDLVRTKQELDLTVQSGYYNILRAEALVTVAKAAVDQSKEQLRVTDAQKAAGVVAEFDVLRARTQLANNEQSLISAKNQVTIAKNAFANTLGIDPNTPVTLTPPTDEPKLPEKTENDLIASALSQRVEMKQLDLALDKANTNVKLSHRGLDPSMAASVSAGYNPKPNAFSAKTTGAFGLSLSYPLGDGGSTKAQIEGAKSDVRQVQIQQDQYLRGIRAEVSQAFVAVTDAAERLESARRTVEQAREAFRLAGVRFKAGVDTQLSVNDAQTQLTQSETNVVNARYDFHTALARLNRAVGAAEENQK